MNHRPVFVDTSAWYALMDASDRFHRAAGIVWQELVLNGSPMRTGNYVVLETMALLQNRLGGDAAALWLRDVLPMAEVLRIAPEDHRLGIDLWMGLNSQHVSLVDCTSFVLMRNSDIATAFTFDRHFVQQGFAALPASPMRE